jgi:hypothetical protein
VTTPGTIRSSWSQVLTNPLRGLALAREKNCFLTWDDKDWIYLLNHNGKLQGQVRVPGRLVAAVCADDGSAYAAVGTQGEIWWLAPDFMTVWEQTMPQRTVAAALDSFGQYLAVSDTRGNVYLFDRQGRRIGEIQSPRPLHHLALSPAVPHLLGCSDFGLVACFDLAGKCLWRDGLVAHIGSMAATGVGEPIVLACYTEGLHRYSLAGKKLPRLPSEDPSRLVSSAFDGRFSLIAGLSSRLQLINAEGAPMGHFSLDKPPVAIALGALADAAVAALPDGTLIGLNIQP